MSLRTLVFVVLGGMSLCFFSFLAFGLQQKIDVTIENVGGETPFFDYPVGIAVDDVKGRVFVSDWGNNRILVLGKEGNLLQEIKNLKSPAGVALDGSRGRLYVAEQKGNRVLVLNLDSLKVVGDLKPQKIPFSEPRGVWVAQDGSVYVADTGRSRVVVFGEGKEETFSFGREGIGDNEFYNPRGVAVDPRGNIWVIDTLHHCVKVFDRRGKYLFRFGEGLNQPRYVAFFEDFAFLSDYRNHRIVVYNLEGKLEEVILEGVLSFPEGLCVDGNGKLWVADAGNNRILRVDLGYLTNPEEYLKTLLREGKGEEFLQVLGRLSPELRKRPEIGRLLFEFYRQREDLPAMVMQAEELFLSDEVQRGEWKKILSGLYARQGQQLLEQGSLEAAQELFFRSFQYGRFASLLSYLWISMVIVGGNYLGVAILFLLFLGLLFVYLRLRTERERRWRRW